MKIYNKTLKKAHNYLKSGQFSRVISLLEPKVPLFIENYHFYYLLGVSCFYSGDIGGAETYLKRAIQVNRKAEEPRLFLASVYLKKKDTTEAVRIWLGLLDLNPACKKAKKGLNRIRRISDQELLNTFLDKGSFSFILPRTKRWLPGWVPLALALLFTLIVLYLSSSQWFPLLNSYQKPNRENLPYLYKEITDDGIKSNTAFQYEFVLTEDEIKKSLKLAQQLFDDFRDNEARKEINRLKKSNAGEQVKLKAQMLESYLKEPDITTLKSHFTYEEIIRTPHLYENCSILWKGRFSNLSCTDEKIEFDFLIGYEDSKVLKGIVPVTVNYPVSLDPSYPLELLGTVEVLPDNSIRLHAVAVHNIIE